MKKTVYFALGTLLFVSCNGKTENHESDSDSLEVLTPEVEVVQEGIHHILTKDSIGSIWIGQSVNEIPDSVPGLYTEKENGASPDAVTIVFKGPEGERFIAYDFGEGKIDVLNLIDTSVKVKAPRGEFGIGDSFTKVLELPGVTEEWSEYDNSGTWYWRWEGLWFAPSQETISEHLSRRLYHSGQAPTRADFDEDVTIGFIGTGLPF